MRCRRASRLSSVRRGSGKSPWLVVIERLASPPIPSFTRRFIMPSWRQGLANGLRPKLPQDLLQHPDAGTEGVAVIVNCLGQEPDEGLILLIVQFERHRPHMALLTSLYE